MDARTLHPIAAQEAADRLEDRLRLLIDTGLLLSSERSPDVIVQAALDAGLALCGAAYGAFFYNNRGPDDEVYQLYKISGIDPRAFAAFPMPRPTAIFAPTFHGDAIVRSDDITTDPRYGRNAPLTGMPPGHVAVCSYLAVPVRSRAGEVLGAMLYGHPDRAVFRPEIEPLVATVAAQAAVAIENSRLTESLSREIAIADRARADQRASDHRLRQALDATQLGTWSWNATDGLIDFDERAAELFGVPPHQPLPRDPLREKMIFSEDLDLTPADLHSVLASGDPYTAEYRIRTADGGPRWIAANGVPTLDEATQQATGMIGTVQDISLRKLQEESLRESEKLAATGRMAATIAHEINNPLEAVTNLIYLAKTDPGTPASVQRMLDTADDELARVAQIAQQTLGFYRDTTRPVSIDLNELLGAVVTVFGRKLAGKRLQVTLDLDPGLSIVGLQGEIRQIVSNLLVNAIDASPATGAEIRIRGRKRHRHDGHGVSVLISDQGSGIPHHVRHRLFTPFVTTKQSRGTGLGLWVTRGMVENTEAAFGFDPAPNIRPGRSSASTFHKPAGENFLPPQSPPLSSRLALGVAPVCRSRGCIRFNDAVTRALCQARSPPRSGQTMIPFLLSSEPKRLNADPGTKAGAGADLASPSPRILVVDDESLIADTIVLILNRNGFIAEAAYSGGEAVKLAKRHCPELVLSDVMMPHVDGVEAAIQIREACPDTRIVLFSGQAATVEILARARERGHEFELLPKPIHPTQLIKHLRK